MSHKPDTVALARVGDLCEQVRGVTYTKQEASTTPLPGFVPVLRAGNIGPHGLQLDDLVFVPAARVSEKQRLRAGDVLIATSSGSLSVVGKAAQVTENMSAGFGAFCKVLRPSDAVDSRYFAHYFGTPRYRRHISSVAEGANINNLRGSDLNELVIELPPIEEQRRIAAVLDQADELRAKRRAALALLDTLTESIFLDMFGDPLREAGSGTLAQAVRIVGGGTPSRSNEAFFTGDICWATSKDMKARYLHDTQEHVTEAAVASSATKLVPPDTVLVVVKSKVLAHTLPVAVTRVPTCFGQDLKGLIPNPGWDTTFIAASLRAASRWLLEQARGVNTEGLTLDHLHRCPMVLATPDRQHEFARSVRAIEEAVTFQRTSNEHLGWLFAALQERAFRGEL